MTSRYVTGRDVPDPKPVFDAWQSVLDLQWTKWTECCFSSPIPGRNLSYHVTTALYTYTYTYKWCRIINLSGLQFRYQTARTLLSAAIRTIILFWFELGVMNGGILVFWGGRTFRFEREYFMNKHITLRNAQWFVEECGGECGGSGKC